MTTIRIMKRTRIGQWNVRTLMEPTRLAQFEGEMEKMQIAIAGISEMRWRGNGTTTTSTGNLVMHSGSNDGGRNGVGIYVSKQFKQTLISWSPISDRIISARFRCNARHITIVQCYAPTEDASDDIKDDFYNALTSSLTRIGRGDVKILMGDFNAKIGPNNNGLETIMGKHGVGSRSNNGDRLIDLCQTFQLVIGGTVFPHKEVHKYTWTSPNGHTRNQIDHICISKKWRRSLMDVRNRRGASIDSDHELVVGELIIKLRRNHNTGTRNTRRPPPLNLHRLGDSTLSTRMATTLREQLGPQQEEHSWELTCRILRSTAEEVLGTRQRRQVDWISTHTWDLINRRNSLKSRADHDCRVRGEYNELCKLVKKSARNDKRKLLDRLAENAESAANANNMRALYQIIILVHLYLIILNYNTVTNYPENVKGKPIQCEIQPENSLQKKRHKSKDGDNTSWRSAAQNNQAAYKKTP
ncbi:craniofacial development protein 2-like [Drosophila ananassae]|uniref:craniofacial development protein 2-like n=1 Tax=Drosophila ananassae TaxID=7217 RepID=UPI001D0004A9|nr:craniofacial development protein 2-like [Drosophila ananassae]